MMTRLAGMVLSVGVCSAAAAQGVTQIQGTSPLRPELQKPAESQAPKPNPAASSGDLLTNFDAADLPRDWKLVNPDPTRWTTQPKKSLLLITQKTPCPNSKEGKNMLLLDRQLPAADFEVIVKASIQLQGAGNQLGMVLWSDDANYFWLTLQMDSYAGLVRRTYFQKVFQGKVTGSFQADVATNDIYLKIKREGNEFSGSFAVTDLSKPETFDQAAWKGLGTLPWIRFQSKLALCAVNYADAPEVGADIYSVRIRQQ